MNSISALPKELQGAQSIVCLGGNCNGQIVESNSKALPVRELKSPQITKLSNSCNFITIIFMILKNSMFISSIGFNWWKVACTYPHRFCGAVIGEAITNNVFVIVI